MEIIYLQGILMENGEFLCFGKSFFLKSGEKYPAIMIDEYGVKKRVMIENGNITNIEKEQGH